jgi:hypothetical protein
MAVATLVFPARYDRLEETADAVIATLPESARRPEVHVGLAEALANAILHGALGLPSRDDASDPLAIYDAIEAAQARADGLTIEVHLHGRPVGALVIEDPGVGFDWSTACARPGHGLSMMRAAFADVQYLGAGNLVRLKLRGAGEIHEPNAIAGGAQ